MAHWEGIVAHKRSMLSGFRLQLNKSNCVTLGSLASESQFPYIRNAIISILQGLLKGQDIFWKVLKVTSCSMNVSSLSLKVMWPELGQWLCVLILQMTESDLWNLRWKNTSPFLIPRSYFRPLQQTLHHLLEGNCQRYCPTSPVETKTMRLLQLGS